MRARPRRRGKQRPPTCAPGKPVYRLRAGLLVVRVSWCSRFQGFEARCGGVVCMDESCTGHAGSCMGTGLRSLRGLCWDGGHCGANSGHPRS